MVKLATTFESSVTIAKGDKSADSKRIFSLMSLGVKQGDALSVTVEGADEDTAAEQIEAFLKENL